MEVRRFDTSLTELGAPIPVRGLRSLIPLPGQGVLMLTTDQPHTLTALGFNGEPPWSRTIDVGPNAAALAVSPDGFASLSQLERTPDFSALSLTAYDATGTARWTTEASVAWPAASWPRSR